MLTEQERGVLTADEYADYQRAARSNTCGVVCQILMRHTESLARARLAAKMYREAGTLYKRARGELTSEMAIICEEKADSLLASADAMMRGEGG